MFLIWIKFYGLNFPVMPHILSRPWTRVRGVTFSGIRAIV
ncbi:hypothetical protein F383_29615 [Gossypium arboreum]|uniref:Uncharacterized protein n=1 Tax=Gossypium arboreum TaxID=29729 RepID=A0A0B0MWM2_GOSAR|nr:hypothetical protein F383_29615 [Gossypium arboreum]